MSYLPVTQNYMINVVGQPNMMIPPNIQNPLMIIKSIALS